MLYQNGVRITTNTSSGYEPLHPTDISEGITAATLSAVVTFFLSTAQPIFVPAGNPRGRSRHLRRPYVRKHFALHACDHLPTNLSSSWTSNRGDIPYGRGCPESSNGACRPHLTLSRESNEACRGYILGLPANINLNPAISSMSAKT